MAEWQSSLFSCFKDITLCCHSWVCPCIIAGRVAEKQGLSCCLYGAICIPCWNLYSLVKVRGMVREAKGIEGSMGKDCAVMWCCTLCGLVQTAKEAGVRNALSAGDDAEVQRQQIERT